MIELLLAVVGAWFLTSLVGAGIWMGIAGRREDPCVSHPLAAEADRPGPGAPGAATS
jgi:hypothetical protein